MTTTCALDSRTLPEMFTLQVYKPLSRTLDLVTFKMDRDFRWLGKLKLKKYVFQVSLKVNYQVETIYRDPRGKFSNNSLGL